MTAINRQPKKAKSVNSILIIGGIIALVFVLLFSYLMWYVAPEESVERVKVVAVTESGCIAETMDGFAVNIGDCQVKPGEYTIAKVDQKTKERAALMNPTN